VVNLTDTHCHLNFNLFQNDLEETLARAWEAGVEHILIPGTDLETSIQAVKLSDAYPKCCAAVGVHPNDALSWQEDTLDCLKEFANSSKVVAIGEIGLDFYRDHAPHDLQIEVFQKQLDLASELNLPVIIHSRQALPTVLEIINGWVQKLKENNSRLVEAPGVLHSFDGSIEDALRATADNFYIGVSGPVTFDNAKERQKIIAQLPVENLLLETDSPFLTPKPHRGQRNEPSYTKFIAEKIAQLKNINIIDILEITSKNAEKLFGWGAL
jgi:TatD DNase family protein